MEGPTSGWERESRGLRDKLELRDFESVNMRFCKEQKNGTVFGGESGIKDLNFFSDGKNNITLFENNSKPGKHNTRSGGQISGAMSLPE